MADNIYGDNNNFNPYVKKEETGPIGGAETSAMAEEKKENPADPAGVNTQGEIKTEPAADNQTAGAQTTGTQAGGTGAFTPDGQYSITRPQGGTNYVPPRPQNPYASYGTSQPQGSPYGGNYQRPYTTYSPQTPFTQAPPPPPAKEKKKKGASAGVVALICAICVVLSGIAGFAGAYTSSYLFGGSETSGTLQQDKDFTVLYRSVSTDGETDATASLNDVVNAVANSVVEITTEFQSMGYFQYVTSGAGSGVIISEDGYIITNNHVIVSDTQVADAIKVRLATGEEHEAVLIGRDADTDIAVIKIEAENLVAAVFSDSDKLVVGQDIVAIGNPLGELGGTVTEGIISALDREVNVDGTTMNLLQISAAVNPGNSGGGLFNMKGELVGIVNAKSSGEGIEGLGFAIPSNDASHIAEELMTNGYVTGKPYVGISLYYASDAYTAYRYFNSQVPGLYISNVVKGYNDGVLKMGDRVIAVEGKEVSTADDVKQYVAECEIGSSLTFSIYRNGELMEVEVTCYEYVPESSEVTFD